MAEAVHVQSLKRGGSVSRELVALRKLEKLACRGSAKELSDALTFFQAGHRKVTLINHRIKDHNGRTLVHLAAQNGNHDCLDVLLHAGDDEVKNARSFPADMRQTPLHLAAFGNHPKCIKVLLMHGANPYLMNDTMESPLDLAAGKPTCKRLLKAHLSRLDSRYSASPEPSHRKKLAELAESSEHPTLDGVQVGSTDPLIAASEVGDKDKVEQLLSDGAEIDSKDSKGRTALITASSNGHTTVTDLLLERGAQIDLQDHQGNSALMSACHNGHVETTSYLLDKDADTFLKNSCGKTAFDLAIESCNTELPPLFTKLRSKPAYPGILFLEGPKRETVTTKEITIDLKEVGFILSIPENSLPSTEEVQLDIQSCFGAKSGSFDVPQDIELVSPAYLLKSDKKVSFLKEVLVKMWHYANLETQEDCGDMVFLSADACPENTREPVYKFREIKGAKGSFRPGEEQPEGQITLLLLLFCILALGKRKHEDSGEKAREKCLKGHLYSARLYKTIEIKVFFCMCLYHPEYVKVCNKVMTVRCGEPGKTLEPIRWANGVQVKSTEVRLTQTSGNEWAITVKEPASILRSEISAHEIYEINDLREMGYPPRIEIIIHRVPTSPDSCPLCLHVEGLHTESNFQLFPDDFSQQITVDTSMIKLQCAVGDLKEEIGAQSKISTSTSALLPIASEMVTLMETIQQLQQCCNDYASALRLVVQLDELERKNQQLKEQADRILLRCLKVKCDLDRCVERANTLALGMRTVYVANIAHCNTSEWQSAVDPFVTIAANLMKAIKDTLKASKLACEIPNNVSSPTEIEAKGLPSFPEVTSYLRKLDNVKLYDLAGELGLNVTDLRNRVSVDSLPRVLCERWLREDDDVQTRSGDPSWSSLAKAMRRIGANGLARKIEKEKINLVLF